MLREEKVAFIRERLESVVVRQSDYTAVIDGLAHVHTEAWLDGVLAWLELNDEWPDAEFELPDFAREILREQAELPDETGPVQLRIGNMETEKLATLWESLDLARRCVAKFKEQHGREPTDIEQRVAISIWIESNKSSKPAYGSGGASQGGVTECPKCGGKVWDNRPKNVERRRDGLKLMPEFKCRDEDQCGWKQWPADARKGGKAEPAPRRQPQPVPAPAEDWDDEPSRGNGKDSDLPF